MYSFVSEYFHLKSYKNEDLLLIKTAVCSGLLNLFTLVG